MKILFLVGVLFVLACSERSQYLHSVYSWNFSLNDMRSSANMKGKVPDSTLCEEIFFDSFRFVIEHEYHRDLSSLYININLLDKVIYSDFYKDTIIVDSVLLCHKNGYPDGYLWISAFDTNSGIYYSWGQDFIQPIYKNAIITLLYHHSEDDENYRIEKLE